MSWDHLAAWWCVVWRWDIKEATVGFLSSSWVCSKLSIALDWAERNSYFFTSAFYWASLIHPFLLCRSQSDPDLYASESITFLFNRSKRHGCPLWQERCVSTFGLFTGWPSARLHSFPHGLPNTLLSAPPRVLAHYYLLLTLNISIIFGELVLS